MSDEKPRYPPVPLTTLAENLEVHLDYLATYGMNWGPRDLQDWIDDHRRLFKHGSRGFHRLGCRCDWCKEADRRYQRANRKSRAQFEASILEDAL